jgi:hypothetical protein
MNLIEPSRARNAANLVDAMTNEIANFLLEELRALRHGQEALRRGQEALRADIADVKITARQADTVPGLAMNLVGYLQLQVASQTFRIDRFEEQPRHIARQFQIADAKA